jgi:two-component system, NtrC family, C4-dicarboxylate transport response regulator DctD
MATEAQRLLEHVVLLVDDEDVVRRITARILAGAGYRVLEAHDGEQAATLLATLGTNVVGLVVSDIRMPGMSGIELAALVSERWPTVPVLLVSGQGGPPASYPGPFLPKPFLPERLLAAVHGLLRATADAV